MNRTLFDAPGMLAWLFWVAIAIAGAGTLTLWPRLPWRRALGAGIMLGVVVAALAGVGMKGYANAQSFFFAPQMLFSLALLPLIALPYLAAGLSRAGGWRDYRALFQQSWDMVGSWVVALLFTGLAWLVLLACAALLDFVDLGLPGRWLSEPPVMLTVTGVLLGLGLAVIAERGSDLAPMRLLRLLPVLIPLLLLVIAVFIFALPFAVRPALPLAGLCMGAVILAATLISALIGDADDGVAASPLLSHQARALCLLMPVLALVAGWALWQRIAPYGLTPRRVCALVLWVIVAGYAFGYVLAVLRGRGWMARVRRVNLLMALGVGVLCALMLTRLLWPEAISVQSQLARIERGLPAGQTVPLTRMRDGWGLPGARAYTRLITMGSITPVGEEAGGHDGARALLAHHLPSLPADHPAREAFARGYPGWDIHLLNQACVRRTPAGHPGCLVVFAALDTAQGAEQAVVLSVESPEGVAIFAHDADKGWGRRQILSSGQLSRDVAAVIDLLYTDGIELVTPPWRVLQLGSGYLGVQPAD